MQIFDVLCSHVSCEEAMSGPMAMFEADGGQIHQCQKWNMHSSLLHGLNMSRYDQYS